MIPAATAHAGGDAMADLHLGGLSVLRAGCLVLEGVTAALPAGMVTALVGPNGAGKSTLLAAVAALLPYRGEVMLDGRRPDRADIAYLPQSTEVRASLTVIEVALLGRLDRLTWRLRDDDLAAAAAALEVLGIAGLAQRRIDTLSGGQQQLALLAQRLVRRPRLLLLDEPTSALDLRRQIEVLELLAGYARTTGAVVVAAMHDLSLAARFAGQVLLLAEGRLIAAGAPGEVISPAAIRAAYGVEAEVLRSASGVPFVAPIRAAFAHRGQS